MDRGIAFLCHTSCAVYQTCCQRTYGNNDLSSGQSALERDLDKHSCVMQNVSAMPGTDFVSVQRVPTTVQGLKQALTNQPVIVGVDASDWSDYYDVS